MGLVHAKISSREFGFCLYCVKDLKKLVTFQNQRSFSSLKGDTQQYYWCSLKQYEQNHSKNKLAQIEAGIYPGAS